MNTKQLNKIITQTMYGMTILVLVLSVSTVAYAASPSPFVGKWEAVDTDGSDMNLAIGGPATGPFQITWTDKYISFCGGEAGIVRGTGWLSESDPNLLEADVHLECFTTGDTLDFHVTFRYHPGTNTLSNRYEFGDVTIWHRPGGGQVEAPPELSLRVNYGHDWVESFYEGGHTAWITVTDGDGNLKATAELVTEPKDFWGGETGFQTGWSDWVDAEGNSLDSPPDIQPFDWVYGWVDNGASAQVQIGEISGTIDLNADSIEGTVNAPWFSDPVQVECLDWGSGSEPPFDNKDGGFVSTNGEDPYSCSWYGEWDIQPGQTVGVGYSGPDGHWVANAFYVPKMNLRVNYGHDWVESFYEGGHTVQIAVTESDGVTVKATAELVTEPKDFWGGETGFQTNPEDWVPAQPDIQPYDWVFAQVDNGATAQVQIGDISGMIDLENDSIEGTIMASWITEPVQVECLDWGSGGQPFDNKDGGSILTNSSESYSCSWYGEWDIQPGQNVGVGYLGPDGHWVANAFYIRPLVLYIHYEYPDVVEGDYELGHSVQVTVFDSEWNTKATATVETMEMPHWGGAPGFRVEQWDGMEGPPDIQPGDVVRAVVDGGPLTVETHIGEITAKIDLEANSITGTVNAPWAGDVVNVLCMPWGAPEGVSDKETSVTPDGVSEFTCSWDSEWDIQPGQNVGVAYWGNNLHWVANAFFVPMPTFVAYLPWAIEGYDWPMDDTIKIYINDQYIAQAVSEQRPDFPEGTTRVLFDVGQYGVTLQANDHIVMTDENIDVSKEVLVTNLAIVDFDFDTGQVFGTYDPTYDLWVWLYDAEGQVPEMDPNNGTWVATFTELPPGAWGGATQWDGDGDGTSLDFQVPATRIVIANQPNWVDSGITVNAGQALLIEAFGLMNPCSDTYPNGEDYCIFYTPLGAEGVVPEANEFGYFPGPGLPFMALLGRIGDGEPFYIGAGGTFTAEESGTLWFTPNDNLRTDNQGAYSVLVWFEP